jgi:hypothetical protein
MPHIGGETALDAEDYRLPLVKICQEAPKTSGDGTHGDCNQKFVVHSCQNLYHLNPAQVPSAGCTSRVRHSGTVTRLASAATMFR